ncbi:MAG: hypothetical protein WCF19_04920 [Chlamydiales bacterium]
MDPSLRAVSELDALRKAYGNEPINQRLKWQPMYGYKIDPQKIRYRREGLCAGMSAHFIFCYLKQLEEGKTPLDSVQTIAPLYANGAPDTAALTHIFHAAQDSKAITRIINKTWLIFKIKLIVQTIFCPLLLIFYVLRFISDSIRVRLGYPQPKRLGPLESFKAEVDWLAANATYLQMMGLSGNDAGTVSPDLSNESLEQFTKGLAEGAYALQILPNTSEKDYHPHAVAFIKAHGDQYFLFDPNIGTLSIHSPKELLDACNQTYPMSGRPCSISFVRCRLKK